MINKILAKYSENKKFLYWWSALFFVLCFFHIGYANNSDDGVLLTGAWNLINGRVLYIDTFEFIPPANFYIIFWIWKIFGVNYLVAKLFAIILLFLTAITLYKIAERIKSDNNNHLIPFFFILNTFYWTTINYNTFNMCFLVFALYYFFKGLDFDKQKYFVYSGLLTGTSILFLQQKGIAGLGALCFVLLIFFIKEKKLFWFKSLNYYFFSCLVPLLFLLYWPPKIIYQHLIEFPISNYVEKGMVPLKLFYFFAFFFLFCVFILRKKIGKKILTLFFLQFCLLATTALRADFYHINLAIFPLFIITPLIIKNLKNKIYKTIYYLFFLIAIILILFPSFNRGVYYLHEKIYDFKHQEEKNKIINYINTNCPGKEDLYAGAFIPQYYFLTKKLSPSPYSLLVYGINNYEQMAETASILEKKRPKCALLNYKIVEKFNYDIDNPVDNFIKNNYTFVFKINENSVYQINK